MPLKIKRYSAGSYELGAGGFDPSLHYIVTIQRRDDLNGWIAAARWDRFLYSDPLPTFREAKKCAADMIVKEVA